MKKAQSKKDERRGLLAKVHIAVKELGLDNQTYEDIKLGRYSKASAADLTNAQLEDLVGHFVDLGWKGKRGKTRKHTQVEKLRDRAGAIALDLDHGEKRLIGFCNKICGVDDLKWCHDVAKLKQLIAALEGARRKDLAEYSHAL